MHLSASAGHHDLRSAVDLLSADLANPRPGADAALPALMDLLLMYLLRDTDDPLATIARRVGYASEFAFANAFRRDTRTRPPSTATATATGC